MAQWQTLQKTHSDTHYRPSGSNVKHNNTIIDVSTISINGSGVSGGNDRYFYYDFPTNTNDKKFYRNSAQDKYGISDGYWNYPSAYGSDSLYNYYDFNILADCHPYCCSRFLQGAGNTSGYAYDNDLGITCPMLYSTVRSYSKMSDFNNYVNIINSLDNGRFSNCAKTLSACQVDVSHFAQVGAMIVWVNDNDTYSHTAIIEEVYNDCIYVSTGSAGRGTCFERERSVWNNTNGWSKGNDSGFTFKGIILNPYIDESFLIIYNSNNGLSQIYTDSHIAGNYTIVDCPNTFTPPQDKVFAYWTKDIQGEGQHYLPNDTYTISENVNFYAQWKDELISNIYIYNKRMMDGYVGNKKIIKMYIGDKLIFKNEYIFVQI